MSTHLTVMPVCLVKAASASFGGAGAASVTVIVTPDVLPDAAELPELPPPQAASAKVSTTAAANAARPWRPRVLLSVLAIAPLLRYARHRGVRTGQCPGTCTIGCAIR